jgi:hypothetical protein
MNGTHEAYFYRVPLCELLQQNSTLCFGFFYQAPISGNSMGRFSMLETTVKLAAAACIFAHADAPARTYEQLTDLLCFDIDCEALQGHGLIETLRWDEQETIRDEWVYWVRNPGTKTLAAYFVEEHRQNATWPRADA